MDGVGCSIVLSNLFNDFLGINEVDVLHVSYGDVQQTILNFINLSDEDTMVIISDLYIETGFLKTILEFEHVKKLLYIDHHERSDSRRGLESLKFMHGGVFQYRWKKGFSAVASAYEFAVKNGFPETDKFDRLVNIIDVYDEWKTDRPEFTEGLSLNSIYWDYGFDKFFEVFYNGLFW